jgi:hypothetical protein
VVENCSWSVSGTRCWRMRDGEGRSTVASLPRRATGCGVVGVGGGVVGGGTGVAVVP